MTSYGKRKKPCLQLFNSLLGMKYRTEDLSIFACSDLLEEGGAIELLKAQRMLREIRIGYTTNVLCPLTVEVIRIGT